MLQLLRRWRGGRALSLLGRAIATAGEGCTPAAEQLLGRALAAEGGAGPQLGGLPLPSPSLCRWGYPLALRGFAQYVVLVSDHQPPASLCCCAGRRGSCAGGAPPAAAPRAAGFTAYRQQLPRPAAPAAKPRLGVWGQPRLLPRPAGLSSGSGSCSG